MRAHISLLSTHDARTDTIWVRRPTAQPAGEVSAPTFRLERPLAGLHDRPAHRSGVAFVAADRRASGPSTCRATARRPSRSRPARRSGSPRRAIASRSRSSPARSTPRSSGSARAARARRSRSRTRSRSRQHEKPVVAVVCEEFAVHAHNVARHLGHGDLQVLVLPYPLEARPAEELEQIARRVLPAGARAARSHGMTLASERVEVPADPACALRAGARRSIGATAFRCSRPPTTRSRRCSPRRRTRPITSLCVLPPSTASRPSSSSRSTPRWPVSSPRRSRSCSPRSKRSPNPSGTRSGSRPRRRACSRCSS